MDEQKQIVQENETSLFSGGFIYFIFFCSLCFFVTGNSVYSVLFAILWVGAVANLCNNELRKSIGYLCSIPLGIVWCLCSKNIADRIICSIPADAELIKIMQKNVVASTCNLLQTIICCTGFIIFSSVAKSFFMQLPDTLKLSEKHLVRVIFIVDFFRLQIVALVCSYALNLGLEKISLPGEFAFLIMLLPWCFLAGIRKKANEKIKPNTNNQEKIVNAIEIPDITLADVAGMQQVKDEIFQRMILPMKNPELAKKYDVRTGGGILLYGPPGTGKTYLAKAVAGELKIPFYAISAADIFSKYVGESEQNIRAIFKEIRHHKNAVMFIDELESIFRKRTDDIHETSRKIISILLQELDGIDSCNNGMLLIGATNTPHLIDEAFLRSGRFDSKIFIGLPDKEARRQIITLLFSKTAQSAEAGLFDALAECTENFSGADLKGLAEKIRQKAFSEKIQCYTYDLFQECLSGIYPSSNVELMQHIRQWESRWHS